MAISKASINTSAPAIERYEGLSAIIDNVLNEIDPGGSNADKRRWIKWHFLYIIWWEGIRATARQQLGGGPARGLMQMEPATLWDLISHYLLGHTDRLSNLAGAAGVNFDEMGSKLSEFVDINKTWNSDRQVWVGKNTWPSGSNPVEHWLSNVDSFALLIMRYYFRQFLEHRFPPQNPANLSDDPQKPIYKAEHSDGWADWWKRVFYGGPNETPDEQRQRLRREFEVRAGELDLVADGSAGTEPDPGTGNGGGIDDDRGGAGCFIATATFGVESREVRLLRRFRDRRLLPSASGRLLTRIYYRTSPPLARLLRRSPRLRGLSRRMIQGMIRWLKLD